MKTQITKENAIKILETIVRQQTFCEKVGKLCDSDMEEWSINFGVLEALFNIDMSKMEMHEYSKYFDAFFDVIYGEGTDYAKKAEKIYNKVLKLTLKEEKQSIIPGVISMLSGKNYRIEGEFGLQT